LCDERFWSPVYPEECDGVPAGRAPGLEPVVEDDTVVNNGIAEV